MNKLVPIVALLFFSCDGWTEEREKELRGDCYYKDRPEDCACVFDAIRSSISYSDYRNIINEQDIVELLKEKGFRIIDLNNMTIVDQIKLFSDADTIISPTSSGLTNLVFCSLGTKIIEISPHYNFDYEKNLKYRYQYICNTLNLSYQNIEADPIQPNSDNKVTKNIIDSKVFNESNYYKDLLVRIDQFEKIL